MTVQNARPKSVWRRIERWMVGIAMGVIAFVLEKLVLRAVKKGRAAESEAEMPTTLTSKGGEIDL